MSDPQDTTPANPKRHADTESAALTRQALLQTTCIDPYSHEEEISIADLLRILWGHKFLIFGTCLAITTLVAIWSLQIPNTHRIQTVIEIGRGNNERVERAEDLVQKMANAYRFQVVSDAAKAGDFDPGLLANWSPSVKAPKGSDLVLVSVDSTQEDFEQNTMLLNQLIDLARKDHNRVLESFRDNLGNNIKKQQSKLAELEDERTLIATRLSAAEADLKLAKQEASTLKTRLAQADADRQRALTEISGQAQALTMLMIENALQADRQQLMFIQRRIDVQIPTEQQSLEKKLGDLKRSEEDINRDIETLKTQLQNFIATRPIVEPTPSLKKVGPKRSLYCLAAAALSFFALYGIFLLRFIMQKQGARQGEGT